MRYPITSIDLRPDQDALEQSGGPHKATGPDQRLKRLRFLIDSADSTKKSLNISRMVVQVLKRVHLVELAARYTEETDAPKKKGQPSVKERFTDLLFPETIQYKSKRASKRKKGVSKRKKAKQVSAESDGGGKQEEEGKKQRAKAKEAFQYWLRLGEPLWRITQSFGHGILLLLPDDVTEAR
jgi:hypothetical protein